MVWVELCASHEENESNKQEDLLVLRLHMGHKMLNIRTNSGLPTI